MLFIILLTLCVIVFFITLLVQEWLISFFSFVAGVVIILFFSINVVQPGTTMYTKLFGNLSYDTYDSGMHLINPMAVQNTMSIQRHSLDFSGENTAEALTSDRVAMFIDATIPYIMNSHAAPLMEEFYGTKSWNLIGPVSRSVMRGCMSVQPWEIAVSDEGRTAIGLCIADRMSSTVSTELEQAGFTSEQAAEAFTFPTAIVRKITPKLPRILDAINQEQAALIDLRRQETLTDIAEEEANRRENEGTGIAKMMNALPSGYTVAEMTGMILANAAKANAEAFVTAVENGNPNITIITGQSAPATVSAN